MNVWWGIKVFSKYFLSLSSLWVRNCGWALLIPLRYIHKSCYLTSLKVNEGTVKKVIVLAEFSLNLKVKAFVDAHFGIFKSDRIFDIFCFKSQLKATPVLKFDFIFISFSAKKYLANQCPPKKNLFPIWPFDNVSFQSDIIHIGNIFICHTLSFC